MASSKLGILIIIGEGEMVIKSLAKSNFIDFEMIFCFFLANQQKLGVAVFTGIFFSGTDKVRLRYDC